MMNNIKKAFINALPRYGLETSSIQFVPSKDKSVFVNIFIGSYPFDGTYKTATLCRIDGDSILLPLASVDESMIRDDTEMSKISKPVDYAKIFGNGITELPPIIIKRFIENYSAEAFGCCSRHIECSNAKKCLHPNQFYSKGCSYRKNLEQNKVFFGVNRNID